MINILHKTLLAFKLECYMNNKAKLSLEVNFKTHLDGVLISTFFGLPWECEDSR